MMDKLIKKIDLSIRMLAYTDKKYLAAYLSFQKEKLERIQGGKPYILCTYYFPSELSTMFEAEFIYIERIVGLAVSCNIIKGKESSALPDNICSYHKAFLELIEDNIIPKPKLILALTYPCNDAKNLCEYLHSQYNIPLYMISGHNYKRELKEIYHILRQNFPLQQSIEETALFSNQAVTLKKEIDLYRIKYPGIVKSDDMLKIFTIENDFGSKEAIDILKLLLNFIKGKNSGHSNPKSLKIFWMGLIPLYDNSILTHMEKSLSCTFVFEEMWMFGNYFLSQDNFFEGLSTKIKEGLFFNTRDRIGRLIDVIKKTNTDLVINFSQKNCSFLPPKIKEIEYNFSKENIILLNLGTDVVQGGFNREVLSTAIKNFEKRKK